MQVYDKIMSTWTKAVVRIFFWEVINILQPLFRVSETGNWMKNPEMKGDKSLNSMRFSSSTKVERMFHGCCWRCCRNSCFQKQVFG
jgi:hypothetical protein